MKKLSIFFLLIWIKWVESSMVLYETYDSFYIALSACENSIGGTATVCKVGHHESPLSCYCSTDAGFGSFTNCLVNGYNNNTQYIEEFINQCKSVNVSMTTTEFWSKYETLQGELKNVTEVDGFNATEIIDYPVKIDFNQFYIDRDYTYTNIMNTNYSVYFGYAILGFWGVILILATLVNWTIHLFPSITGKFTGPISNFYRRNITLASAFRNKRKNHAVKHIMLIPSRFESIIILVFFIMCSAFSGIGIRPVPGNSLYPSISGSLARLIAIRTGILVGFICPFLVLFAGRNNFLQWLTRWNFATFITYHRWVSRMAALLVIIHAITFTISDLTKGAYQKHMSLDFVQWGVVAGVAGGIILVQGLLYVRRKSYELFLIIHILMALFFIVGGYYHTIVFGYGPYYWASIAIWALDRCIRISRMISFGSPMATVTLLADETLRVIIPKPKYWHAIPGGHAFIQFLKPSCFWQSHPFTFTDSSEKDNYIIMYIKLKGGVTHGVYKYLNKFPGATAKIRVLVEGPYGEASSAKKYKNSVFIAGGNGIPGIYSECIDLSRKKPNAQLKLIWILREWKSLAWFYQELKNLNTTNIETTIFVTKPEITTGFHHLKGLSDSSSTLNLDTELIVEKDNDENKKNMETDNESVFSLVDNIKSELNHITFKEGRPNIESLVQNEIQEADGSTAFITCGHPVMVDEVRYSVANNLDLSSHRIEYFEQLQVWA